MASLEAQRFEVAGPFGRTGFSRLPVRRKAYGPLRPPLEESCHAPPPQRLTRAGRDLPNFFDADCGSIVI